MAASGWGCGGGDGLREEEEEEDDEEAFWEKSASEYLLPEPLWSFADE